MKAGETSSKCPRVETERNWGLKTLELGEKEGGLRGEDGAGGAKTAIIKRGKTFETNSCSF